MHYGKDPLSFLDHINGDTLDDGIENLRDVVLGRNNRNKGIYDGSLYVTLREYADDRYLTINRQLRFSFDFWPDEDAEAIQQELHDAIAPIVDRIYANRRGRQRPPSEKIVLSPTRTLGNAEPGYRRNGR
jgi:hypothetical protein